jgi:hypothetical protein
LSSLFFLSLSVYKLMIADLYRLYPGRWNKIKILRSLSLHPIKCGTAAAAAAAAAAAVIALFEFCFGIPNLTSVSQS